MVRTSQIFFRVQDIFIILLNVKADNIFSSQIYGYQKINCRESIVSPTFAAFLPVAIRCQFHQH
jgi:hypothetical protein